MKISTMSKVTMRESRKCIFLFCRMFLKNEMLRCKPVARLEQTKTAIRMKKKRTESYLDELQLKMEAAESTCQLKIIAKVLPYLRVISILPCNLGPGEST